MFFRFGTANKTNGCIYLTSTDWCKNLAPGKEPEKTFAEVAKFEYHDLDYCKDLKYRSLSCTP